MQTEAEAKRLLLPEAQAAYILRNPYSNPHCRNKGSGYPKYIGNWHIAALLALLCKAYFSRDEMRSWLYETWMFTRKIFPLLLIGISSQECLQGCCHRTSLQATWAATLCLQTLQPRCSAFHVFPHACRGADGKDVPRRWAWQKGPCLHTSLLTP